MEKNLIGNGEEQTENDVFQKSLNRSDKIPMQNTTKNKDDLAYIKST